MVWRTRLCALGVAAGVTGAGSVSANEPPVITDIAVAPALVAAGQTVRVTAAARDFEGQPLTFTFTTSQGTLTGAADQDATVDWTLPAGEGTFLISLVVQDSQGGVARAQRRVTVGPYYPFAARGASVRQPARVAVGASDDLWVTDSAAGRVVHLGQDGSALGAFAVGARPLGIARLADGRLLVGEDGLDRVAAYSEAGTFQSVFASGVTMPNAIAQAPDGTVHVVDSRAALVHTYAADGTPGATYGGGSLTFPVDLAISSDGSERFVADQGTSQIRVFDAAGTLLRTLGARGTATGQFMRLEAVALTDTGVLALDSHEATIQLLSTTGTPLSTLGGLGVWPSALRTPLGLAAVPGEQVFATSSAPGEIEIFASWAMGIGPGVSLR